VTSVFRARLLVAYATRARGRKAVKPGDRSRGAAVNLVPEEARDRLGDPKDARFIDMMEQDPRHRPGKGSQAAR